MWRTLLVRRGRDPFQVLILTGCALASVALVALSVIPSALHLLPLPIVIAWEIVLALGGFAGLLGTWWRGDINTALLVQGAGLLMAACMLSYYVISAFWLSGVQALAGGMLLASIAASCWWRLIQIIVDLRRLDQAKARGPIAGVEMVVVDPDNRGPDRPDDEREAP